MAETVPFSSSAWRVAGGSNSRRGLSNRAVPLARKPLQRLQAEGAVQAAIVFNEAGTAFVADMAGAVQAYRGDGAFLWRVRLDGGISATPAVHAEGKSLVVGTHAGSVFALDAADGTTCWHRKVSSQSDPRILSDLLHLEGADLVVFSSWGGRFHALEARTGQEQFSWDAGISPRAAVAAEPGRLYCLRARIGHGVEFVRVDVRGQEEVLLRQPENERGARRALVAAAPVLDEERTVAYIVLNQMRGAQLLAWSLKSEEELWRQALPASVAATPTILKTGEVVVVDLAGSVHRLTAEGILQFHRPAGCDYLLAGGVAQSDGTFWVGDPIGMVHRLDRSGAVVPFFEAPRSIQARLSFDPQGRLYVPCADHSVYVFGG